MKAAGDILSTATGLVGGDRAAAHGDILTNYQNVADIWNGVLKAKFRQRRSYMPHDMLELSALDCLNMMEALKIARRYSGSHNLDDYIDGAGYAGCAGEVAELLSADAASRTNPPAPAEERLSPPAPREGGAYTPIVSALT